jgi:hypothetical protein
MAAPTGFEPATSGSKGRRPYSGTTTRERDRGSVGWLALWVRLAPDDRVTAVEPVGHSDDLRYRLRPFGDRPRTTAGVGGRP